MGPVVVVVQEMEVLGSSSKVKIKTAVKVNKFVSESERGLTPESGRGLTPAQKEEVAAIRG